MGKISDYANVLKSKLTDLFVVYQRNDGELETKNATLEQLGDAICGEQVHATLETDDKTIIGGINENKDKVGDLSQLTTTDKSSLVGAVNKVNSNKADKSGMFKIQSFSKSYSVGADSTTNFDNSFITVPSGYTIAGVVGYTTNQDGVVAVSVRPAETSQWAFQLRKVYGSAVSGINFTVTVMFVKSDLVV